MVGELQLATRINNNSNNTIRILMVDTYIPINMMEAIQAYLGS